ncbi:MAG: hypothetical protein HUJ27_06815 [Rhodobacteraceae bacterium]|nr:hypothetical protein [Paracoccaceae bacterium]
MTIEGIVKQTSKVDGDQATIPRVLVVGRVADAFLPDNAEVTFAHFSTITSGLLDDVSPDIVISPMLEARFDCLDLASVLHQNGFRGVYSPVLSQTPKPTLILAELLAQCPGLDIHLIQTAGVPKHRLN